MLTATELQTRLHQIEQDYLAENDVMKALLLAKLATLEVGGWTEECIDKIVTDFLDNRMLRDKKTVIAKLQRTYGFKYNKDFRSIIVELVGVIGFEKIEDKLSLQCQQLETALDELKHSRDTCAHTYTKPSMTIDGPSKMIKLLTTIENALAAFCNELHKVQIQP